jgi:hypothetical protein
MESLLALLILTSLILLITGLFRPDISLFGYNKPRTRGVSVLIYVSSFIILSIIAGAIYTN